MIKATDAKALVKDDLYQVFLFACPANMPFFFAVHPWLVINKKGSLSRLGVSKDAIGTRWEVLFGTGKGHAHWGHVHKDLFPPFQGIAIFRSSTRFFWNGWLIGHIEGGEGSLAQRMADFIDTSAQAYPYKHSYSLMGPNSNTYVQWVLQKFPESRLKLPWNAFGKNFA